MNMATIYIDNVPDDLYARLQQRAATDHRSFEGEIVALLEGAVAGPQNNADESEEVRLAGILQRASEWSGPYEWVPEGGTESGTPVSNKMLFWRVGANRTPEEEAAVWETNDALRERLAARYGPFPDSVEDIRALRAERESREWR
jgi:plasmid stability protein